MIQPIEDIDLLLEQASIKINNLSGNEYLKAVIDSLRQVTNMASCCIYELKSDANGYQCSPQNISSESYYDLLLDVYPGQSLINSIIDENIYTGISDSDNFLYSDKLLSKHNAHFASGFLLNNLNNKPIGLLIVIDDKKTTEIDFVKSIIVQYIDRINAELDRVILSKELNKSKTDLNYLFETSRDLVWEVDVNGFFVNMNRSSITIYGYYRDEMIGKHYSDFMSSEAAIEFGKDLKKSIQGNGIYDIVTKHINKSGRPIQIIFNAKPKYDSDGVLTGYTGSTTDITESIRAQVVVKNNSELFSAILSRLPVVFFRIDQQGVLIDIRGQGLRRMGVNDMEWVGKPGYGLFLGMDEMIDTALSGETVHFESTGTLNGEPWWFYTSMFFDSWTGYGAVGFAVDITDQKIIEKKLVHLLKDNRELAQRLVEVQEEERRNLARELHDELGQSITAVKSLATAITVKSGKGYSDIRSLGNSIIDLSGRLYEVVNTLMRRLRPDILDSLGFEATINSCIDNSQLEKTGVNCNLHFSGDINGLDEIVQVTAYRIVQESLTNISKYAMASNIEISIIRKTGNLNDLEMITNPSSINEIDKTINCKDCLVINIEDDGIGMDLNVDLKSSETDQKMGLQGMQERVTALGGELLIQSEPGQGVSIMAVLDLTTRFKSHNGYQINNDGSKSSSIRS